MTRAGGLYTSKRENLRLEVSQRQSLTEYATHYGKLLQIDPTEVYPLKRLDILCQHASAYCSPAEDKKKWKSGYTTLSRIVDEDFEEVAHGQYTARSTLHNRM